MKRKRIVIYLLSCLCLVSLGAAATACKTDEDNSVSSPSSSSSIEESSIEGSSSIEDSSSSITDSSLSSSESDGSSSVEDEISSSDESSGEEISSADESLTDESSSMPDESSVEESSSTTDESSVEESSSTLDETSSPDDSSSSEEESSHTHSYTQQVTDSIYLKDAATCISKATYYYSCECGEKGTTTFEFGELKAHTYTAEWSNNETEHWHACVCGDKKDAASHIPSAAATETTAQVCTECGYVIAPALGHVHSNHLTKVDKIDSTCTEEGNIEYYTCDCGWWFADENAATRITDKDSVVIAKKDHVFDCQVTDNKYLKDAATCTNKATYYYSCECGEKGTEIFVYGDLKEHTFDQQNADDEYLKNAATCVSKATYYYSCECGEKGTATFEFGALAAHTESDWVIDTEPTYTSEGSKHTYCTVCENVLQTETIEKLSPPLAYTVNSDDKTCTITGIGTYTATEIEIPEKMNGYKVTAIGEKAFSEQAQITSLTLPDTITTIGTRAFYGCSGLTEFTVPASVEDIGTQIFYKTSVKTVYYNASYGAYNNPFLNLSHITSVVFNGKSVPSYVLYGCVNAKNVTIGNGVTSIGDEAFRGCSSLTSIEIPDSVTSIGWGAFKNCSGLTSITIPDSVASIENGVFSGCSGLTSITIPDGVTSIGDYAFANCSSLTSITIPDSVTSIGTGAFSGCSGLTSIVFEDTVGWYRTTSWSSWNDRNGGISTNVANSSTNVAFFLSNYSSSYWYKN